MDWNQYIKADQKYYRSEELEFLKGDSGKIRRLLRWEPKYTFEEMLDEMLSHWFNELQKIKGNK